MPLYGHSLRASGRAAGANRGRSITGRGQYLFRLVELAVGAKRCELDNGNTPQLPLLSEADGADAEAFLADILLCLPVMGVTFFEKAKAGERKGQAFVLRARGVEARGIDSPEGLVILAESKAVKA